MSTLNLDWHRGSIVKRKIEQTRYIGGGSTCNFIDIQAEDFGNRRANQGNKGWFVGLSTVRDGRQKGTVGFDQKPVRVDRLGHFSDIVGSLEGHHPGNADIQTQFQDLFDNRWPLGERVANTIQGSFPMSQDPVEILPRIPVVEYDRQPGVDRKVTLPLERPELILARRIHVVVVQPDFAHRHDSGLTDRDLDLLPERRVQ